MLIFALVHVFAMATVSANRLMDCDGNTLTLGLGLQTIRCRLTQAPTSDITINLASQSLQMGTCSLTFNSVNWNQYQSIPVQPLPAFVGTPSLSPLFPGNGMGMNPLPAQQPSLPSYVLNFFGSGADPFYNQQRYTLIGQMSVAPQMGMTCTVSGGPNYRTFSGEQFSNQNAGAFTLLSTNRVQVQILQTPTGPGGTMAITAISVAYGSNVAIYDTRDSGPNRRCTWRFLSPNAVMTNVQFSANGRTAMARLPCGTTLLITNNRLRGGPSGNDLLPSLGIMIAMAPGHASQQGICAKPVGMNPSVFLPMCMAPNNGIHFAGQMSPLPTTIGNEGSIGQSLIVCNVGIPSPQPTVVLPTYNPIQMPPLPTMMPLPATCDTTNPTSPCYNLPFGCNPTNPASPCYNMPPGCNPYQPGSPCFIPPSGGCNPFQPNSLCPLPQNCNPLQPGSPCYMPMCNINMNNPPQQQQPIPPISQPFGVMAGGICVVTQTVSPTLIVYPTGFPVIMTTTTTVTTTLTPTPNPILVLPTLVPCDTNVPGNTCATSTTTVTSTNIVTVFPPSPTYMPLPTLMPTPPPVLVGPNLFPSPSCDWSRPGPACFGLPNPQMIPSATVCNPNIPGSGCYIPPTGTPAFLMNQASVGVQNGTQQRQLVADASSRDGQKGGSPPKAQLTGDNNNNNNGRRQQQQQRGKPPGWTQNQAAIREFCQRTLAVPTCSRVLRETSFYVDACIMDILTSGTYDVAETVKHDYMMACQTLTGLSMGTRMTGGINNQTTNPGGTQPNGRSSLLDPSLNGTVSPLPPGVNSTTALGGGIPAAFCPNSCSKRGSCLEYGCLCNVGYGGIDCSVSVSSLPPLTRNGRIRQLGEFDISALNVERADMILTATTTSSVSTATDTNTMATLSTSPSITMSGTLSLSPASPSPSSSMMASTITMTSTLVLSSSSSSVSVTASVSSSSTSRSSGTATPSTSSRSFTSSSTIPTAPMSSWVMSCIMSLFFSTFLTFLL